MSIRARVCADAIEAAGADRVITMDLYAPQVVGFFRIPVDDRYAMPVLCEAVQATGLPDLVVVAPDAGFAKEAKPYARRLGAPPAIADKERADHPESAQVVDLIGDVVGRTALIVDDFTVSAGTLDASPIKRLFVTDTVESQQVPLSDRVETVSVAGLFGEAIRRIASRQSVSVPFHQRGSVAR